MKTFLNTVEGTQEDHDRSFLGGVPCLPEVEHPACRLCGAKETFFFQLEFPDSSPWRGKVLALFACTKCCHEDHLIPEMLKGPLLAVNIPKEFLTSYQTNFSVIVAESEECQRWSSYKETICFKRLILQGRRPTKKKLVALPLETRVSGLFGRMAPTPKWFLGDETPATCDGNLPLVFLFQIQREFAFEIHPDAPGQIKFDYFSNSLKESEDRWYKLFISNEIYFFGTAEGEPLVYILTQI